MKTASEILTLHTNNLEEGSCQWVDILDAMEQYAQQFDDRLIDNGLYAYYPVNVSERNPTQEGYYHVLGYQRADCYWHQDKQHWNREEGFKIPDVWLELRTGQKVYNKIISELQPLLSKDEDGDEWIEERNVTCILRKYLKQTQPVSTSVKEEKTTDFEREAEERFPYELDSMHFFETEEERKELLSRIVSQEPQDTYRKVHIKACQMHSTDGLDDLVEWMETKCPYSSELIITKAKEIKSSLNKQP